MTNTTRVKPRGSPSRRLHFNLTLCNFTSYSTQNYHDYLTLRSVELNIAFCYITVKYIIGSQQLHNGEMSCKMPVGIKPLFYLFNLRRCKFIFFSTQNYYDHSALRVTLFKLNCSIQSSQILFCYTVTESVAVK